ncbi:XdhC family protein [Pedobacter mucosus]|uniref:XdhC family protein n=1 Tax=Pedobacter mucosus TaxID=2895286 RepID=UPI001EE4591B|nr:XdhC/CoxI family protein [Pedobacter mucosus]UKT62258.1 XdhC family protein [Pedobacter mucosus]
MKEIKDILISYARAEKEGKKTALATVVKVEGSSYRRPGARMLITEDGILTGAISGGCLEGDALRKALSAILQQENKLITYDTTDEDDAKFGVQLGCNGIVHILFEPIKNDLELNPITFLKGLLEKRENAVLVTLFSLAGNQHPGTNMLYTKAKQIGSLNNINNNIEIDCLSVLESKTSEFKKYSFETAEIDAFIEFIAPPITLIIAGAGNDVQPLVDFANILGWEITIVDGRPTHANISRFPLADQIIVSKPENVFSQVNIDVQTAFVLMTHNYNYDLEMLGLLLKKDVSYIGVLGPKKKLQRMFDELEFDVAQNVDHVYGPVGLDIGAETSEEIAISIVAEIKSVFAKSSGKALKEKTLPIHFTL